MNKQHRVHRADPGKFPRRTHLSEAQIARRSKHKRTGGFSGNSHQRRVQRRKFARMNPELVQG